MPRAPLPITTMSYISAFLVATICRSSQSEETSLCSKAPRRQTPVREAPIIRIEAIGPVLASDRGQHLLMIGPAHCFLEACASRPVVVSMKDTVRLGEDRLSVSGGEE